MFTGYTDQTVDVFWGIRFNNDRAWFAEHKQEFQDAVMAPTKALAAEQDKYLRLAAEYDNYRKRTAKEKESLYTCLLYTSPSPRDS